MLRKHLQKVVAVVGTLGLVFGPITALAAVAPKPKTYNFNYDGAPLASSAWSDAVAYRQSAGTQTLDANQTSNMLQVLKVNGVNSASFDPGKIDTLSFTDKGNNYYVTISRNSVDYSNMNLPAIPKRTLTASDVPSDADLIAVTDQFIKDHEVAMSAFGGAFVDRRWQNANQIHHTNYIPPQIMVVYPYHITNEQGNTENVVDSSGQPTGLAIFVDVLTKQVRSARIPVVTFAKANDLKPNVSVTDVLSEVIPSTKYTDATKYDIQNISVGTPKLVHIAVYDYGKQNPEVVIIPALSFPLTTSSSTPLYSNVRIVPLVRLSSIYTSGEGE